MANVSFANLDQGLNFNNGFYTAWAGANEVSSTVYSFQSSGGHDWDFVGTGFTYSNFPVYQRPAGGTVNTVYFDLDNDDGASTTEMVVTGLSIPLTDFGIFPVANQPPIEKIWRVLFAGHDTFDFRQTSGATFIAISGDGVSPGPVATATPGDDVFFFNVETARANGQLIGDYNEVGSGVTVTGGDDTLFGVGHASAGDFGTLYSDDAIGGDDTIAPVALPASASGAARIAGDVIVLAANNFTAGDDLIDLRATDMSGVLTSPIIVGDVAETASRTFEGGDDTVFGSAYSDIIYGENMVPLANVYGIGGADLLFGGGGNDEIFGQAGADTLDGEDGDDTLRGGTGDDLFVAGPGADYMDGETGFDTVSYAAAPGAVSIDFLFVLFAGEAAGDYFFRIEVIEATAFSDSLTGGDNGDYFIGLAGDDTLLGRDGNDFLFGGFGRDRAEGGAGNDFIRSGPDNDTLLGGDGDDTLGASNRADLLRGEAGRDLLLGSNGNDRLFGGEGDDSLLGGNGRDTLYGDAGADRLVGGAQADTASYEFSATGVWVSLSAGAGSFGEASGDVLIEIENLKGSAYGDSLTGNAEGNVLDGGNSDDSLSGLAGNDILFGGLGDDTLAGGSGDDRFWIRKGDGSDIINDFDSGSDAVRLFGFGPPIDSFAEVMSLAIQQGASTVINFGGGHTLTLVGVAKSALTADDFIFG